MITDGIGRHEVLLPILIITITKFVIFRFKSKHKKFQEFFASSEKKKPLKSTCVMAHTVQLLSVTRAVLLHCPISAEIGTVDSQSDLRILL